MGFDWETILGTTNVGEGYEDHIYQYGRMPEEWNSDILETEDGSFALGVVLDEEFIIEKIALRTSQSGTPYLDMMLRSTENWSLIRSCIWQPTNEITAEDAGKEVYARGTVDNYYGKPFLELSAIHLLYADEQNIESCPTKNLADLTDGDEVTGEYILRKIKNRIASNGKPFLDAILTDEFSWIAFRAWDYHGFICEKDNGKRVSVSGKVERYNGRLYVNSSKIELAEGETSEAVPSGKLS